MTTMSRPVDSMIARLIIPSIHSPLGMPAGFFSGSRRSSSRSSPIVCSTAIPSFSGRQLFGSASTARSGLIPFVKQAAQQQGRKGRLARPALSGNRYSQTHALARVPSPAAAFPYLPCSDGNFSMFVCGRNRQEEYSFMYLWSELSSKSVIAPAILTWR